MNLDFVGIGAQKCATTWLYTVLSEHPDIGMAMPDDGDKDTRFFSYFYDRGFAWYEDQYPAGTDVKVQGEISTSYFCSAEAPARLAAYAPDTKLILCLRNPIERAFSHHKHEVSRGRISGANVVFERALAQNPMYLEQSLYHRHLQSWLRHFELGQIQVVFVEDIHRDARAVIRQIYEFLDVASDYQPFSLDARVNESRTGGGGTSDRSVRAVVKLLRKLRLDPLAAVVARAGGRFSGNGPEQGDGEVFAPMTEETRRQLAAHFENENQLLATLLGRDLSFWSEERAKNAEISR